MGSAQATGTWSFDITSAGFTTVLAVHATAVAGATGSDEVLAVVTAASASSVAGKVLQGGADNTWSAQDPLVPATAAATVFLTVDGY